MIHREFRKPIIEWRSCGWLRLVRDGARHTGSTMARFIPHAQSYLFEVATPDDALMR